MVHACKKCGEGKERQPIGIGDVVSERTPLLLSQSTDSSQQGNESTVADQPWSWRECALVVLLCICPLSKGFVTGYASPTLDEFKRSGLLSTSFQISMFTSAIYVGSAASCFVNGWLADRYGRRFVLFASSYPLFVGWLLIISGRSPTTLIVGRMLNGFGSAVVFTTFNVYIAEIVHERRRGRWTVFGEAFISVGSLMAFGIGQTVRAAWMAVVAASLAVIMSVVIYWMPETPRYLIEHQFHDAAYKTLSWVRKNSADDELIKLQSQFSQKVMTIQSLKERIKALYNVRRRLATTVTMMFFQGMCGHAAVNAYLEQIIVACGWKSAQHAGLFAVGIGVLRVLAAVAAGFSVDRCGRKILFVVGGLFQSLLLAAISATFFIHDVLPPTAHVADDMTSSPQPTLVRWSAGISLFCIALYMAFYSFGWGNVPSIITAELFPQHVRSLAVATSSFTGLTSGALCSYGFQLVKDALGQYQTFALLAGVNLAGALFGQLALRETKQRTLEEIDEMYSGRSINEHETV